MVNRRICVYTKHINFARAAGQSRTVQGRPIRVNSSPVRPTSNISRRLPAHEDSSHECGLLMDWATESNWKHDEKLHKKVGSLFSTTFNR